MNPYFSTYNNISNEEWPDISSTTDRIGNIPKMVTTMTNVTAPEETIDLKKIHVEDLKTIHKQDPFTYYSIPGVRSANMHLHDIDTFNNVGASVLNKKHFSCPSSLNAFQHTLNTRSVSSPSMLSTLRHKSSQRSQALRRSSRISFECHPDLLLMDMEDGDF